LPGLPRPLKRQCWRQRREAHLERHYGQEAKSGGQELGSFLEALPSLEPDPAERVIERDEGRRRLRRLKTDERTALGMFAAGFLLCEIAERRGWDLHEAEPRIAEERTAIRSPVSDQLTGAHSPAVWRTPTPGR